MKRILFICLLMTTMGKMLAQDLPDFDHIKLKKPKDYKAIEPIVLRADDYVLSTPINRDSTSKINAAAFLMNWMEGTPDYIFTFDESTTKSFLQNAGLVEVYIAYMSKFAVQNKAKNSKAITINAIKNLLDYINNPANNVTKTNDLKALSEANDKGELESFLNL
jgi:hypothetical protein